MLEILACWLKRVEGAAFGADVTWEVAAAAKSISLKYEAGFALKFVLSHLHPTILHPVYKRREKNGTVVPSQLSIFHL